MKLIPHIFPFTLEVGCIEITVFKSYRTTKKASGIGIYATQHIKDQLLAPQIFRL